MRATFDSSALAKRYLEESGSEVVQDLLLITSELGLSVTCLPEIVSALNRCRRQGGLTLADYRRIKGQLVADVRDATVLNLTPSVIARAVVLLEEHELRAADSLHVACAVEWRAALFVSADRRQSAAAREAGLEVRYVGAPDPAVSA